MTKKLFEQPEMMVVNISKGDVIATSFRSTPGDEYNEDDETYAPDRLRWEF